MSRNYPASGTVHFKFTTLDVDDVPVAPSSAFAASDLRIYKGSSATQRTSSAGITVTSPFNSLTGLHHVAIDLADNTDAGFYAAGNDYQVILSTAKTVDGFSVDGRILLEFSIANRDITANVTQLGGSTQSATDLKDFADTGYDPATHLAAVDVIRISGDATAADNAEAFFDGTGYPGTNNVIPTVTNVSNMVTANMIQISGDGIAADNCEAFFDGTGYAGTNNTIPNVTTVATASAVTMVNGIAANVINNAAFANDAISLAKIADGAIGGTKIANSALSASKFADQFMTAAKFAINAVDANALAADAVAEIKSGLSTLTEAQVNAQCDLALSDAGVTSARMGYLDNANVGGPLASAAGISAITQAQKVRVIIPDWIERPDSGSLAYRVWIYVYNETHTAEDLDSNPTVTVANNAGTDRSANLGTVTKPGATTGQYYVDYTLSVGDTLEQLNFKVSATEGAVTTVYPASTLIVDTTASDFTAADRAKLDTLHDTRLTAGRAAALDLLDVAVSSRLAPTNAGRTLDVSTGGEAGIDWANIGTPGATVNLSGTTIGTLTTNGDKTGYRLSATGVDDIWEEAQSGHTTPGTFGVYLDAAISSRLATAGYTAPLSSSATAAAVWDATRAGHAGAGSFGEGVLVQSINTGGIVSASFAAGAIDAAALGTDAITNAKIADDAIGSNELAASAIAEIQSGLSTLTAAGVRSAIGMAAADLDAQLDAILANPVTLNNASFASVTVDTVPYLDYCKLSQAALYGKATVSGTDVSYLARDGSTAVLTVTAGATNGQRTASVIV